MTTLALATVLYSYLLGGVWEIGPFTDLKSCEAMRTFQMSYGINNVTECMPVVRYEVASPTYGAPLTPDEYARRTK